MFKFIWFVSVILTAYFWISDEQSMRKNVAKETIINGDTLKILDYHSAPFTWYYDLDDGSKVDKPIVEENLIK